MNRLFWKAMTLGHSTAPVVTAYVSQLLKKTIFISNAFTEYIFSNWAVSSKSSCHFQSSRLVRTSTQSGNHGFIRTRDVISDNDGGNKKEAKIKHYQNQPLVNHIHKNRRPSRNVGR
jgi:hypothetical protein